MHQRLQRADCPPSLLEHVSLINLFLVMRNIDVRETRLLEDGLRRVEDLLPSSWEASIFAVEGESAAGTVLVLRGSVWAGVTYSVQASTAGALP